MIRAAGLALALGLAGGAAMAETQISILSFDDLEGWSEDRHDQALAAFQVTCGDMRHAEWRTLCALSEGVNSARGFFETFFLPVLIEDGGDGLFTGYFEPLLRGSREPDDRYRYPVYRLPPEARGQPWLSRRAIEQEGALEGLGLEIAWVDDPVALFFMQVQGSGRIRIGPGDVIRLGYAGSNGRNYTSVGQRLVTMGLFQPHEVSADVISNWVSANPVAGQELLWTNASFVFFRELSGHAPELGPLGAMNRPLTQMRSIAVDPAFVPLGTPVWIEKGGADPLNRLMVAQDTGSAIKGAQRADVFYGTGRIAGRRAGRIRDGGRMVVLLPIQRAYAMLEDSAQ